MNRNGRVSFNDNWRFLKGDASGAHEFGFDDSSWRELRLPHDWAIEGPFDEKYNARCGGLPFHGTGWYRKRFYVPEDTEGNVVAIEFDGAMCNSEVWVNGEFLGSRPFGYMGFQYDLSGHLKYGGENVIAVKLSPEDLSSRWYPGAGLYRNVWLEIKSGIHIGHWGTSVTTPEVSDAQSVVNVQIDIVNGSGQAVDATVETALIDDSGNEVASAKTLLEVSANENSTTQSLEISDPRRWDVDDPFLYRAVTRLLLDGDMFDWYQTPFGVRTIEYRSDKGFLLNGRHLRLNGVCMHHDLGPLGAAVNRRATERQLQIMKEMGVNAIRTSHNPPSPQQLEYCDRLGILAQVEAFDVWEMAKVPNGYNKYFEEWHERDLRDMIRRDRNHPSVIMWSIGNEILEQRLDDAWKITRQLAEICRDEDSTRPVTIGLNNYPKPIESGMAAEVDLVGLNYKPLNYSEVKEKHPEWILYGSETSSCTSSRGEYHLPIEKYSTHDSLQVTSYDLIAPPWAYPPDVEFDAQEHNPSSLGEFIWTGFDYLGEPTPYGGKDNSTNGYWNGHWPSRSSYFGAVDLCGFPKDRFYLYQSQWTEEPMVHVLPHWNLQGYEGTNIPIYCYTNCDEAELIVNGSSLGRKVRWGETTTLLVEFNRYDGETFESKYRMRWDAPYQEGSLKVVGYRDGQAVCEQEIVTAGEPGRVGLQADRSAIDSDGYDLSFVTVRIEDEAGNLCPKADNLVRFDLTGPGEIAAVGNGNAATTEPFQADYRQAFNGLAMVILRSKSGESGEISLIARSEGLQESCVVVTST